MQRYGPACDDQRQGDSRPCRPAADAPEAREVDPNEALPDSSGVSRFRFPRGDSAAVAGLGSGFIVSPDGMILTNAHGARRTRRSWSRLTDKREFTRESHRHGSTQTDVAVIKIEATDLRVVKIGDPSAVRVGEWVVAIGSPIRLRQSRHGWQS